MAGSRSVPAARSLWGTLVVNVSGSVLLGLLFALAIERGVLPASVRAAGPDRVHRRLHDLLDPDARELAVDRGWRGRPRPGEPRRLLGARDGRVGRRTDDREGDWHEDRGHRASWPGSTSASRTPGTGDPSTRRSSICSASAVSPGATVHARHRGLRRQAASPLRLGSCRCPAISPILIEVVDQEDRLRAVLPELDAMVGGWA